MLSQNLTCKQADSSKRSSKKHLKQAGRHELLAAGPPRKILPGGTKTETGLP